MTEKGLIQIIDTVYADDENERVCSELSIKKSFDFFLESELQEQFEQGAEDDWEEKVEEHPSELQTEQLHETKADQKINDKSQPRYTVDEIMQNPDILINALNRLKEEQEKNRQLAEDLSAKRSKIAELEPKAEYYDKILNTVNGVSPSVIAKEYGKSALWLNKLLHKLKIQYRQGETWVLYSRYMGKGYTCTKTHQYTDEYGVTRSVMHTYWTQVGRKFIYDTLKDHNIEPIA